MRANTKPGAHPVTNACAVLVCCMRKVICALALRSSKIDFNCKECNIVSEANNEYPILV